MRDGEFVKALVLPGVGDVREEDVLAVVAGCAWVEKNTRYRFDGSEVPAEVKLFLMKYWELWESGIALGVQAERMAGMSQAGLSQTFAQRMGMEELVRQLAAQLLGEWYSPVAVVPAERKFV